MLIILFPGVLFEQEKNKKSRALFFSTQASVKTQEQWGSKSCSVGTSESQPQVISGRQSANCTVEHCRSLQAL